MEGIYERQNKQEPRREHQRFLATPVGPEESPHWFEADYDVYPDGSVFLVPGTLKDFGCASSVEIEEHKKEDKGS